MSLQMGNNGINIGATSMESAEFRILGPVEAIVDGRPLALGGPKQRALLALLLVRARTVVSVDDLIDEVWGVDAPPTVRAGLQVYLSRVRRLLGAHGGNGMLVRHPHGYALMLDLAQLDATRFEQLAREGREALARGEPARAAEALSQALSLWRGPALADLGDMPFAQSAARRLEDLRLQTLEDRFAADLELGSFTDVVPELQACVAEHPYRERFQAQLMLALYQSGRQAEALEAYAAARRRLTGELGLEPSPELRRLEQAILRQDPALNSSPTLQAVGRTVPPPGDVRHDPPRTARAHRSPIGAIVARPPFAHRRAAVLGSVAILLGVALLGLAISQFAEADPTLPPRSLAMLDPQTLEPTAILDLDGVPSDVVVGRRAAFVAVPARGSVVVVDPRTRAVVSLGAPVRRPTRFAVGRSGLWVLDALARRVALLGSTRVHSITEAPGRGPAAPLDAIAADARAIWVAERAAEFVFRLDARDGGSRLVTNGGRDSFFEGDARRAVAVAAGSVWATNPVSIFPSTERLGRVSRLDSTTGEVLASIRLPAPPVAIAADDQGVWVALERGEALWRIDPNDNVASSAIRVPGGVIDLAIDARAVWALGRDGEVSRIDPALNAITARIQLGRGAHIAAGAGAVWVAAP